MCKTYLKWKKKKQQINKKLTNTSIHKLYEKISSKNMHIHIVYIKTHIGIGTLVCTYVPIYYIHT